MEFPSRLLHSSYRSIYLSDRHLINFLENLPIPS
ncbi:hypothetical protein SPLC1_S081760 [Arthrospira platensis C1]|nr:hypothetical protein SPLC1_S081760 [Arthrospira platensis C1]